MSHLKGLLVLTCLALVLVTRTQSEPQNPDKQLRFSRLLNQRPDLLLHTSISNTPTANTPRKDFIKGQIKKKPIIEEVIPEEASSNLQRAYLHGEAVRRVPQALPEERNDEETLTTINQRPISGRIPVSILRQSSGNNRLNISPVFSEPDKAGTRRRPLVENVTERQEEYPKFQNDVEPEITTNPSFDDEDVIVGTTERVFETEEEIPPAPLGPSPPVQPNFIQPVPQRERAPFNIPDQIAPLPETKSFDNWRTFIPLRVISDKDTVSDQDHVVIDNSPTPPPTIATTTTTSTTTTPTTTTTPSPVYTTTIQNDVVPAEFNEKENLLGDTFHRKGQFPDFEDSPSHLATAESNTPARVNVRPASSGKDYEYEYIYYYYDDDDDDNSTSTTKLPSDAPSSSVAPTVLPKIEPESSRVVDSFAAEKIQTSKISSQSNTIERSRESKTLPESDYEAPAQPSPPRGPQRGTPATTTTTEDNRFVPQEPTTELPEPVKIQKPIGSRPILLKQSSLIPTTTVATTTTTTTERSTTSEVPASRQAGSRFRPKDRFDSPKQSTKFAPPVQSIVDTPPEVSSPQEDEPPRRTPNYKETSRRTPTRRPVPQQPQVEEPVTEKLQLQKSSTPKAKVQLLVPEDQPRPSSRTRFPPRIQPTSSSASGEVGNGLADSAPSNTIVEVTPPQLSTLQPNSIELDDRKAKDNFARTKSINDLYALTRLHQLAINTRIPNRKTESAPVYKGTPPKFAGGFISSSEGTTQIPEDHLLSEATTITAFIPPSHVSSQVSSTTEQSSSSSDAPTEEHFGGKRNRGFRGRQRPTQATSTTTTEAPARQSSSNRFGGRRKTFTPAAEVPVATSVASTQEGAAPAEEQHAEVPSSQAPALRQPGRHRFSGRTRPSTTSTTENPEGVPAQVEVQSQSPAVEQPTSGSPPRRLRPGAFGQNRRRPTSSAAPQVEGADAPAPSEAAPAPVESEPKRRPGVGKTPRNRPVAGGTGPIIGRPLRLRKTTTTTTEAAEPAQEYVDAGVEQSPTAISEQVDAAGPVAVAAPQKVTISSSTTVVESPVEPTQLPKRGSAAALGRLRPRPGKPAALPTTVAPEVTTVVRKPSRLNGILNRKKLAQTPTTVAAAHNEEHEETPDNGQEQVEALPKGTIVQVSTIVSESEETPDHNGEIVDDHGSAPTTAASILNRLKSQRKPGSLFRKRVE